MQTHSDCCLGEVDNLKCIIEHKYVRECQLSVHRCTPPLHDGRLPRSHYLAQGMVGPFGSFSMFSNF
jgi:hypothetical protein